MLRGHSRIKASTCIPRRWMAGSPCWWPIGVEIEMNPYIPEKSHVSHGCFFLPKLLNWDPELEEPVKPFFHLKITGKPWEKIDTQCSLWKGTIHVLGATMVGWEAPLKIFSGMGRVQAGWLDDQMASCSGYLWRVTGSKEWLKRKRI